MVRNQIGSLAKESKSNEKTVSGINASHTSLIALLLLDSVATVKRLLRMVRGVMIVPMSDFNIPAGDLLP